MEKIVVEDVLGVCAHAELQGLVAPGRRVHRFDRRHRRHRLVLLDVPAPEQELAVQVRPRMRNFLERKLPRKV